MMKTIDLRSDTITLPDEEMIESIKISKLGDDVYGEDSLVNQLEEKAAKMMGKEAGLLLTSGTQGNLVGILSQTNHGDEIILEKDAHIFYYEVAGISAFGGLMPRTIAGKNGIMSPEDIKNNIRVKDIHQPVTSLVSVEQTHNRGGGIVIPTNVIDEIGLLAKENNMAFHMDGARVFNAATYLKTDVSRIVKNTSTVQFCLSKGLSAPIGSLLVGPASTIEKARKFRKMLGGGMRQAGVIAGPGIIALEKMTKRLQVDHDNATLLSKGLKNIPNASWTIVEPQTNIVKVTLADENAREIYDILKQIHIKISVMDSHTIRFTTHRMINSSDIEEFLTRIENYKPLIALISNNN